MSNNGHNKLAIAYNLSNVSVVMAHKLNVFSCSFATILPKPTNKYTSHMEFLIHIQDLRSLSNKSPHNIKMMIILSPKNYANH